MNKPRVYSTWRHHAMHLRSCLGVLLVISQIVNSFALNATHANVAFAADPNQSAAVSPELQYAISNTSSEARLRIIVRFKTQADLSAAVQPPGPVRLPVRQARVRLVNALQAASLATQDGFAPFLNSPAMASRAEQLSRIWIFNGAVLSATPGAIRDIASRSDVESITLDRWLCRMEAGIPSEPTAAVTAPQQLLLRAFAPLTQTIIVTALGATASGTNAWGITQIHADQTWSELGINGSGVTVATIDTGVDWQHPALQSNYRGWRINAPADHLHNWYDATDEGALYPNDLNGHGTHTMGTLAGQGGIGVAPGARWMAAKGLNGQGFGYDSWLHAAFQFIIAPGGDPNYAPDVLSNSWSDTDGSNTTFQDDLNALRAASIFTVFANGNSGPRAGSVNSPASLPNALGIGATDPDDEVAFFSSRGPSPFGEVRPVLSAPGLNVLSSFPGGRFAIESGTSMATPHVAGAAALVLSANPGFDITGTLYALTSTAMPLTSVLPSNDSGWGRVDAFRAALSVTNTGIIKGVVLDGAQPISGALVMAGNGTALATTFTGVDGTFAMPVMPGIYTATAVAFGYYPADSGARIVVASHETTDNFDLLRQPYGTVSGSVFDVRTSSPLTLTMVSAVGTPRSSMASSGQPPSYTINLPTGIYTLEARLLGYTVQTRTIAISESVPLTVDFSLTPTQRIALVDTGAWYYGSADSYYRSSLNALLLPYDFFRVKHVPADTPTITNLLGYDTVIWSAPLDAPALVGAGDVISTYLKNGRNLLISGQDIGFYDGGGFYAEQPYFDRLNAYFLADAAPSRVVVGTSNGFLAGMSYPIAGGEGANNQFLPDIIDVRRPDHGEVIARYTAGLNGSDGAAVYSQNCLPYRAAYFAFGLEAIDTTAQRSEVIHRVLDVFDAPRLIAGIELQSRDDYHTTFPIGLPGQTLTHTVRLRHTGDAGITDTMSIGISGNEWSTAINQAQVTLAPCASALVTISVTIPLTASRNARDVVTFTVTSANSPTLTTAISLTSKTPAGILLVDDDRFYDREQDYIDALAAMGNYADRWDNRWRTGITAAPSLSLLSQYPILVWFNG
ncbi:MAG TPA: S8 family serine peptidase, partial [Anaerolineae bacterium]